MANLYHFSTLSSTNTYAKEHAAHLCDGDLIWADIQTQGKGRLGRNWVSPDGNLFLSVFYKNPTGDFSLYPLLSAIAVCRTLGELCTDTFQIKWPNDIIFHSKKLCGILCESIISSSQIHIICGIGINVNGCVAQYQNADLPYATSLSIETGKHWDLEKIVFLLSEKMEQVVSEFSKDGFDSLKSEYESLLINVGKQVHVIYHDTKVIATAQGIADNGNLICTKGDGTTFLVNSGEASVRGLYGYV